MENFLGSLHCLYDCSRPPKIPMKAHPHFALPSPPQKPHRSQSIQNGTFFPNPRNPQSHPRAYVLVLEREGGGGGKGDPLEFWGPEAQNIMPFTALREAMKSDGNVLCSCILKWYLRATPLLECRPLYTDRKLYHLSMYTYICRNINI